MCTNVDRTTLTKTARHDITDQTEPPGWGCIICSDGISLPAIYPPETTDRLVTQGAHKQVLVLFYILSRSISLVKPQQQSAITATTAVLNIQLLAAGSQ